MATKRDGQEGHSEMPSDEARAAATKTGLLVEAPALARSGEWAAQCAAVEDAGCEAIWVRDPVAGGTGSVLFAAAVAGLTRRVRIGVVAAPSPALHPLRLAEDLAMLDIASGGRLDWVPIPGGAMSAIDHAEYLHVVAEAWRGEAFAHEGARWPFPELVCVPSPEQRPHPRIWLPRGADRPSAADEAMTAAWLACSRVSEAPEGARVGALVWQPVQSDERARRRDELAAVAATTGAEWLIVPVEGDPDPGRGLADARRRWLDDRSTAD